MTTRDEIDTRRSSLHAERRRCAALRVELARLGGAVPRPGTPARAAVLLAVAALAAVLAVRELRRAPKVDPSAFDERRARHEVLVAERAAVRASTSPAPTVAPPAPPPAPPGSGTYPALGAARDALGADDEELIGWAHVAMAACTVGEESLAREIYAAQLFAAEVDRREGNGVMHPVRNAALGALDLHCRDHRIHLVVPPDLERSAGGR